MEVKKLGEIGLVRTEDREIRRQAIKSSLDIDKKRVDFGAGCCNRIGEKHFGCFKAKRWLSKQSRLSVGRVSGVSREKVQECSGKPGRVSRAVPHLAWIINIY
jgi:hypothetical protein